MVRTPVNETEFSIEGSLSVNMEEYGIRMIPS